MIAEDETDSRQARAKGDKRVRTRASLLEAARALIREKGHEKTTLEAIAERAGMTTGAIYGNFKNRDELFIALGQTYWTPIKPRVKAGASFAEVMRAMADATIAAIPDRSTVSGGTPDWTGIRSRATKDAGAGAKGYGGELRVW